MLRRYQYWSKDGIKWTNWFFVRTNKSLEELRKQKIFFKKLKEEWKLS